MSSSSISEVPSRRFSSNNPFRQYAENSKNNANSNTNTSTNTNSNHRASSTVQLNRNKTTSRNSTNPFADSMPPQIHRSLSESSSFTDTEKSLKNLSLKPSTESLPKYTLKDETGKTRKLSLKSSIDSLPRYSLRDETTSSRESRLKSQKWPVEKSVERVKYSSSTSSRNRSSSDSSVIPRSPSSRHDTDKRRSQSKSATRHRSRIHDSSSTRSGSVRDGTKHSSTTSSRHHRKRGKDIPVDTIDKLDVTGYYGKGTFHHDGPFEACTPHRNKNKPLAPVLAFPSDGANNSLTALPKADLNNDIDNYAGINTEAYANFNNFNERKKSDMTTFDPSSKVDPIYGAESLGLGRSTFLDGAPAAQSEINRATEERLSAGAAGLGRTKSLVQRIKSIKRKDSHVSYNSARESAPLSGHNHSQSMSSPSNTNYRRSRRASVDSDLSFKPEVFHVSTKDAKEGF